MKQLNFCGIQRVKELKSSSFSVLLNAIAKLYLNQNKPSRRSVYMSGLWVFVVMALVHWNYTRTCCGLCGIAKGNVDWTSLGVFLSRDLESFSSLQEDTEPQWTYTHLHTHTYTCMSTVTMKDWTRIDEDMTINEGLNSLKMSQKDGYFLERPAVTRPTFIIACSCRSASCHLQSVQPISLSVLYNTIEPNTSVTPWEY